MSDEPLTNGHDASVSRILTLDAARKPGAKRSDWLTRAACEEIVRDALASEIPKIHQFYLDQIPGFVRQTTAELIHGALLHYELIVEPTPEAPVVPENVGGDTTAPDTIATEPAA